MDFRLRAVRGIVDCCSCTERCSTYHRKTNGLLTLTQKFHDCIFTTTRKWRLLISSSSQKSLSDFECTSCFELTEKRMHRGVTKEGTISRAGFTYWLKPRASRSKGASEKLWYVQI